MEMQGPGTTQYLDVETAECQPSVKPVEKSLIDQEGKEHGIGQFTHKARQEASKVADAARRQIGDQLTHQKDRAAATLADAGAAIRQAGKDPRQLAHSPVAPFTAQAAEQVEKMSTYLRRRDITALQLEVERFARTRTSLFVACALAGGWLGARLLKSRVTVDSRRPTYTPTMLNSTAVTR